MIEQGKKHFDCSNFSGAHLENEGKKESAGSHFEKLHYGNELMTSKLTGRPVISGFTTSVLKASGWYLVSDDIEETLEWGRAKGCSFLNDQCLEFFGEFCQQTDQMNCTVDFSGKTLCDVDKYTDGCSINAFLSSLQCDAHPSDRIRTNDHEIFGAFSRCLPLEHNNKQHTGCFKTKCDSSMSKISISYQSGDHTQNVQCNLAGQKTPMQDSGISIVCPDPKRFCQHSGVLACKNDCSGVGVCKSDKRCFCDILYQGDDCSKFVTCSDSLCHKLLLAQNTIFLQRVLLIFIQAIMWN